MMQGVDLTKYNVYKYNVNNCYQRMQKSKVRKKKAVELIYSWEVSVGCYRVHRPLYLGPFYYSSGRSPDCGWPALCTLYWFWNDLFYFSSHFTEMKVTMSEGFR